MQGTQVRSLVWEDPTCRRTAKPARHNCWAYMPQLLSLSVWSPCSATREATATKPLLAATRESPRAAMKTQRSQKKSNSLLFVPSRLPYIIRDQIKDSLWDSKVTRVTLIFFFNLILVDIKKNWFWGLPWWSSGKESALQCRGRRFDPWSGNYNPMCCGTTKPACHNYWAHTPQQESPCAANYRADTLWSPRTTARERKPTRHN